MPLRAVREPPRRGEERFRVRLRDIADADARRRSRAGVGQERPGDWRRLEEVLQIRARAARRFHRRRARVAALLGPVHEERRLSMERERERRQDRVFAVPETVVPADDDPISAARAPFLLMFAALEGGRRAVVEGGSRSRRGVLSGYSASEGGRRAVVEGGRGATRIFRGRVEPRNLWRAAATTSSS